MSERLTRIAIVSSDRCKPKKCRQECKKSCPVVKTGMLPSSFSFLSRFYLFVFCPIAVIFSIRSPLKKLLSSWFIIGCDFVFFLISKYYWFWLMWTDDELFKMSGFPINNELIFCDLSFQFFFSLWYLKISARWGFQSKFLSRL